MVFLGIRTVYGLARQFVVVFIWIVSLLLDKFGFYSSEVFRKEKERNNSALFTVFTSSRGRNDAGFHAFFTIEMTLVLGVVFMSIASMIQYAYTEHDKVTGTAILEEMLIRARRDYKYTDPYFEDLGEQLGNPRLWLGDYELEISTKRNKIAGKASAGEWHKEIEMNLFRPDIFIRETDSLRGLMKDGDENDDREYRVQAGDEPKLYGDSFGNGAE